MLSNGNYAQYFPQAFMGAYGAGAPQFGAPNVFSGVPGAYGVNPGFGQEFGPQGFGPQLPLGTGQIVLALSQLAQQVATQGVLTQQIGASLGQLAHIVAQTLQTLQSQRYASPASLFGGFGSPGFGSFPGQTAFGGFTPQTWGINRPAMAS